MAMKIQSVSGAAGYRDQLDRARRFLDRVVKSEFDLEITQHMGNMDHVEFQDMMWSFFQHCWHVKDWIRRDPVASSAQKTAACRMAERSTPLKICRDLCNGTKHLQLDNPGSAAGANYEHIDMTIAPEKGLFVLDCVIDDGRGNLISAKQLAHECIADWERILKSQGLDTARMS